MFLNGSGGSLKLLLLRHCWEQGRFRPWFLQIFGGCKRSLQGGSQFGPGWPIKHIFLGRCFDMIFSNNICYIQKWRWTKTGYISKTVCWISSKGHLAFDLHMFATRGQATRPVFSQLTLWNGKIALRNHLHHWDDEGWSGVWLEILTSHWGTNKKFKRQKHISCHLW